jgi:HEAT repeat protein
MKRFGWLVVVFVTLTQQAAWGKGNLTREQIESRLRTIEAPGSAQARFEAAEVLGQTSERGHVFTLKTLFGRENDGLVRLGLALALADMGERLGVPRVIEAVERREYDRKGDFSRTLYRLVRSLTAAADPRALPMMRKFYDAFPPEIDDESGDAVQENAAFYLGRLGTDETLGLLRGDALGDRDPRRRILGVYGLGQQHLRADVRDVLLRILRRDESRAVRAEAAGVLRGEMQNRSYMEIIEILGDADEASKTKHAILDAIWNDGLLPEHYGFLTAAASGERDRSVRRRIKALLRRQASAENEAGGGSLARLRLIESALGRFD